MQQRRAPDSARNAEVIRKGVELVGKREALAEKGRSTTPKENAVAVIARCGCMWRVLSRDKTVSHDVKVNKTSIYVQFFQRNSPYEWNDIGSQVKQ